MLWLWMGLSWAASPCDGSMALAEAVEAADAAWVAVPSVAGVPSSPMEPVWIFKGKETAAYQGSQPLILLRVGEMTCARLLMWRQNRDFQELRAVFGRYAAPESVDPEALGQIDPRGLAARPGTRIVAQRFNTLILSEWHLQEGACPTSIELRVFRDTEHGPVLLQGRDVVPDRSLGCIDPKAAHSPCMGRWDMGPVDDSHLSAECPADAVAVSDGGMPWCVDIQTCERVPFVGR